MITTRRTKNELYFQLTMFHVTCVLLQHVRIAIARNDPRSCFLKMSKALQWRSVVSLLKMLASETSSAENSQCNFSTWISEPKYDSASGKYGFQL